MQPAIYTGSIRHRRFAERRHEFCYQLFMVWLDIDRLPEQMQVSKLAGYNRFNWATFAERDHFGDPALPLRRRLESSAAAHGVRLSGGPVYLLTHLRYLGHNFNPISLFYCYRPQGELEAVLAEVNSTFGERHNYWLSAAQLERPGQPDVYRLPKRMHVSPFLPMNLEYRFVLPPPGERLAAHIGVLAGERVELDATLELRREPWSAGALRRALLRFPWMTAKVIAAIHWQALRLLLLRVPIFTHPSRRMAD
jgi:DUF1365 family protein